MSLTEILGKLHNSDEYPLHMPGGKRDYSPEGILSDAYGIDITEIEGYDNLYDAQGILKDAMNRAAKLYDCPNTYYLVNGSTTGIITAIYAATSQGDHIIIARNCHRSVYSAIELRELSVTYIECSKLLSDDIDGGITRESVLDAINKSLEEGCKPSAVVITSPNYDGIISDIKGIAEVTHAHNIPLIVDEAHGAHLSLDDRLPMGAIKAGADIVIHSTHKTLAAMTQTALLHIRGELVDITKIKKYWHTFQTSSPSYVLMASIDAAINDLVENGRELWDRFLLNRSDFDKKVKSLKHMHILNTEDIQVREDIIALDPCKITVITDGSLSGTGLQRILLDDYHIQLELAGNDRIIAIVTYADKKEGFDRFARALTDIDQKIDNNEYSDNDLSTQASASVGNTKTLYAPCIPNRGVNNE